MLSYTTEFEWVRRCVIFSLVFHQPPFPTGAARCVLFSQISWEIRLLIVANCSLLLQLSLVFFFSSVFTRQLIHVGSLQDIVTVLRGRHVSIKVISFAWSWETDASTFVELNNSDQSSGDKVRYNACFRCYHGSRIVTFRRSGLILLRAGRTTPFWSVVMRIWIG